MARAKQELGAAAGLYERDFCLWAEQQAGLLRRGVVESLDLANLADEIDDLSVRARRAVKSNLVVVLMHLLKHQFQPRRRSRSWRATILEHRQRLRDEFRTSPSLQGHAREIFDEAYADARARAAVETGLHEEVFPASVPYTLDQALDPAFLPD